MFLNSRAIHLLHSLRFLTPHNSLQRLPLPLIKSGQHSSASRDNKLIFLIVALDCCHITGLCKKSLTLMNISVL